jgi:hypothetical protein
LGQFRDATATPYLIKGLRHKFASGLYHDIGVELQGLTGQNFGEDFEKWHQWWQQTHPGDRFDFDSDLGVIPVQE